MIAGHSFKDINQAGNIILAEYKNQGKYLPWFDFAVVLGGWFDRGSGVDKELLCEGGTRTF